MPAALVILAAGAGSRVGADRNKCLLPLGDATVLGWSLRRALGVADVARVVVVARAGEEQQVGAAVSAVLSDRPEPREVVLVTGGATRQDSEWAAVEVLADAVRGGEVDVVAVHDAARPLAPTELWERVVGAAREHGGAIPGVPVTALATHDGRAVEGDLLAVQTPQAFRAAPLLAAFERLRAQGRQVTDTAGVLEDEPGVRVVAVTSSAANLKVTWPDDLAAAEALLAARG